MSLSASSRKFHRWGALLVFLPLGVVLGSGILLQLKKEISWVQPPTMKGTATKGGPPRLSLTEFFEIARSVPQAGVESWSDIERIDIQPGKNLAKVQTKNRWEVQMDVGTGKVMSVAYRRSDLIESIHDGSWFHEGAKLGVFLPAAVVLAVLWVTGLYLFVLPHWVRARKRRNTARREAATGMAPFRHPVA